VEILKNANGTAEKAQKLLPSQAKVDVMKDKIGDRVVSPTSFDFRYRDDVVKGVPLWNVFDAITYIYTACFVDMFISRECELHLYQLRTIFNVLGSAVGKSFKRKVPSTMAATWCKVGEGRPLVAGFAASYTRKNKVAMAKVRRKYVDALVNLNPVDKKRAPNASGNYPEFITWSIVCRDAGNSKSLCLSNFKEIAYQFCGHFEDASKAFVEKKSKIEDFFDKSSLIISTEVRTDHASPGCKLKSAEALIKDGRVKRKRTEETEPVEETEKMKKMKKTEKIEKTRAGGRSAKRPRK
jgi:hypothetical protein